jgi:DNA-directed RNA polymerase subunit L
MAEFKITAKSKNGFKLSSEFRNFPVTFVNSLRRIMIHGVPTVAIRDVQILGNTTQMPHEMLKHRMELLPVNVLPDDAGAIRDALIELRIHPDATTDRLITTDDFVVEAGRNNILMKDRDLDTPLLFLRVRKNEMVHMRGRLAIDTDVASQVCTATMFYHLDEELVKQKREEHIATGEDVRVFDNFLVQRHYSRDEMGRPNWINLDVESVGVMASKKIIGSAVAILKQRMDAWLDEANEKIGREPEPNSYRITLDSGGHTVGSIIQEIIYHSEMASFVSYDVPHPLRSTLVIRIFSDKKPEDILKKVRSDIHEYCAIVEKEV